MKTYCAWTVVANQFVQYTYEAENLTNAWRFAVDNLYPKGSTKLLRVMEAASFIRNPHASLAEHSREHLELFSA